MRDSLPRAVTLTDRQPARPRAAQPGRQQVRRANTRMYASASAVCMVVAACGVLRTLVVELGVSLRVDVGGSLRTQLRVSAAHYASPPVRAGETSHVSQDTRANFACWSFAPPIWQGEGATGKPSGGRLSRLLPVWCSSSYREHPFADLFPILPILSRLPLKMSAYLDVNSHRNCVRRT